MFRVEILTNLFIYYALYGATIIIALRRYLIHACCWSTWLKSIICFNLSADAWSNLGTIRQGNFSGWLKQDIRRPQSEKKTMRRTMRCQWRTLERSGSPCHIHQELYGSKKLQGGSSSQSRALHPRGIVPRWQATSNEEQWIRVDSHHIRRPQPKPKGILSSVRDPSSLRNLSGLNSPGLWYFFSSCVIALKNKSTICLERPLELDFPYVCHHDDT